MIKEILFPYPQSHSVAPVCFHARPVSEQIPVFHASMGLTDSNLCLLCLSSPPPCIPLLLFLCFCPKDGAPGKIDGKMYVYMCVLDCACVCVYLLCCPRDSSSVLLTINSCTPGDLTILVVCMTCLHDISPPVLLAVNNSKMEMVTCSSYYQQCVICTGMLRRKKCSKM